MIWRSRRHRSSCTKLVGNDLGDRRGMAGGGLDGVRGDFRKLVGIFREGAENLEGRDGCSGFSRRLEGFGEFAGVDIWEFGYGVGVLVWTSWRVEMGVWVCWADANREGGLGIWVAGLLVVERRVGLIKGTCKGGLGVSGEGAARSLAFHTREGDHWGKKLHYTPPATIPPHHQPPASYPHPCTTHTNPLSPTLSLRQEQPPPQTNQRVETSLSSPCPSFNS